MSKRGKLIKFPKAAIVAGVACYNANPHGRVDDEDYTHLKLRHAAYKKWFIHYAIKRETGPFTSKKLAIHWFTHAGR